jgi:hypothetical protein
MPLLVLLTGATYIAIQPPAHLSSFQQGMTSLSRGQLVEARLFFNKSIESEASFDPARYQRGRTFLMSGEVDLAMNDFGPLAVEGDVRSMAYLAYCFNLKDVPTAAIAWYERAMRHGASSMQVYNNVGASYLSAQTSVTVTEQMKRAELYLLKAWELDSSLPTVRLNLVRLATAKSRLQRNYNPFVSWRDALSILTVDFEDEAIRYCINEWYDAVLRYEANQDNAPPTTDSFSGDEIAARRSFEHLKRSFSEGAQPSARNSAGVQSSPNTLVSRYFLEPLAP